MQTHGILETSLYASNLAETSAFYTDILELQIYSQFGNRHVFFKFESSMLLLFNPDETSMQGPPVNGGLIGIHGAIGAGHVAFRIFESEIDRWRARLQELGVAIESEVTWPGGGYSIYFRDPAGNSVELATPALWKMEE